MSPVVFGCIVPHPPIMVPEVGQGREAQVLTSIRAMGTLAEELAAARPQTVFLISPHGPFMPDSMGLLTASEASGDLSMFGAPEAAYRFPNDLRAVDLIREEAASCGVPLRPISRRGYTYDHGVCVPLYFLHRAIQGASLVPLTFSMLPLQRHFDFGGALRSAADRLGKRVAIVASGDLSHRLLPDAPAGYDPIGHEFDRQVCQAVAALDSRALLDMDDELVYRAGECGLRSFTILFGALSGLPVRSRVHSYEGPFGVGYMVASLAVQEGEAGADEAEEMHPLARLAKEAVESFVRKGSLLRPPVGVDLGVSGRAGVFVTIRCGGALRGCIGTIEPTTRDVCHETIVNAIGSACRDPRFIPICSEELDELTYEVSVLGKPELAGDLSELSPKVHGVIVEKGRRRGLLLPDIDGVDTVEQQLAIAMSKAGIRPDEDGVTIHRFEVRKYT